MRYAGRKGGPGYSMVSLFSGAMGLDIGIESTGRFQSLLALESNPVFCETIRTNRDAGRVGSPAMDILNVDIRQVTPEDVMERAGLRPGQLDVLVGGPPCQSFSSAGRRQSVRDPRGELLWDFLRFIVAIRPKVFVMENVRGLTSAALRHRPLARRPDRGGPPLEADEERGSVLDLWVRDLREKTASDYRVDCFEVNAVNYGAPQLRERAMFIGNRFGAVLDWPSPTHGPEREPFRTLRDAIGELRESNPILLDFSPRKKSFLAKVPPGGNWRALPEELQMESMGKAWYAKGGRSGWWRRLSWDLPCPTIVTMPNHASTSMCHPEEVRVLSLGECAAVQEFPEGYDFAGTTQQQYEQVGNAVPTRLGKVASRLIVDFLDSKPRRRQDAGEPFRKVYIQSQVRTRQWYKAGHALTWNDGEDNKHAEYSLGRASSP